MGYLIDGDYIIERLEFVIKRGLKADDGKHYISAEAVLESVKKLPPVEPERKPGKWLYCVATNDPYGKWKCSECGKIIIAGRLQKPQQKFCSNCGAKMEVQDESNA